MGEPNYCEWENEKLAKIRCKVFRGHDGGVNSCCFFNDDRYILSAGDDKTLKIWSTENGLQFKTLFGHKDEVSCCVCSSDGRKIISVGLDKYMIVWDALTNQPVLQSSHEGMVMCCDISYDSKYILTCTDLDNAVYLWDLRQEKSIAIMKYHRSTVMSCRFARNSYRFCTTSMDLTARVVDILDYCDYVHPHGVLKLNGHSNMVSSCDFSFDERWLCTGSWDSTVLVWDLNSGTFRNDGPLTLKDDHIGCISACAFSKSGSMILSSSFAGTQYIWDVKKGCKKLVLRGHHGWVTDCDFSMDENRIITSSKDGTLRFWNIENYDLPSGEKLKSTLDDQLPEKCGGCGKLYLKQSHSSRRCVFCRILAEQEDTE